MKNKVVSADYSYSFNPYVYEEIGGCSVCLDVGCFTGTLGKRLIPEKGCIVDGIDYQTEPLKTAIKNGYRKTFVYDLSSPNLDFKEITEKYDYIIFADVLEHLVNPTSVLSLLKTKLKSEGKMVISLPNVAFALNRLILLPANNQKLISK